MHAHVYTIPGFVVMGRLSLCVAALFPVAAPVEGSFAALRSVHAPLVCACLFATRNECYTRMHRVSVYFPPPARVWIAYPLTRYTLPSTVCCPTHCQHAPTRLCGAAGVRSYFIHIIPRESVHRPVTFLELPVCGGIGQARGTFSRDLFYALYRYTLYVYVRASLSTFRAEQCSAALLCCDLCSRPPCSLQRACVLQ